MQEAKQFPTAFFGFERKSVLDYIYEQDRQAREALEELARRGLVMDTLRLRAFPFPAEVFDFINRRELVFVIEQNRDGQMRTLLISEGDLAPERLVSITSYDGLPVASRFLVQALESALAERGVSVPPAAPGQGETP